MSTTFTKAVEVFLGRAYWLGEDEKPATVALEKMAETLDKNLSAALVTQYNQTFRYLHGLKPTDAIEEDELDAILGDS
ncbi:hypothetical protein [Streptomyces prunicolor]|uniref:hypothetical protein n=1 Tax=Streptomyces prunicolor TaxID=67348 RepID=UPI00131A3CFA|nr:hypothetical protein [Streptomyces prunicolor]